MTQQRQSRRTSGRPESTGASAPLPRFSQALTIELVELKIGKDGRHANQNSASN